MSAGAQRTWRVLVADDDPGSMAAVRSALGEMDELDIIAEATTAADAVRLLGSTSADLAVLDVQMPDGNGLDIVAEAGVEAMPPVVFVTAYDRHAVRAFDLHAVDYVLKPFDNARLQSAVRRAIRTVVLERTEEIARSLGALVDALGGQAPATAARSPLRRFVVRGDDVIRMVDVDDVDWIEASGNYIRLHVGDETFDVRGTLRGTLQRLDPARFVRIHRSWAVNVDRVAELHPWFGGDYIAVLESGEQLRVSRTYRNRLLDD